MSCCRLCCTRSHTSQACIRTAYHLYAGILDQVERLGYDVFTRRAVVPTRRRVRIAMRCLLTPPGTRSAWHPVANLRPDGPRGLPRPAAAESPGPLLPRPLLFRRLNAAIARVLSDPPEGTLSAAMSSVDNAVEEIRVALAAGYDTTAHALAWALWHLADEPRWCHRDVLGLAIDETLRLYPAGWLGSRIAHRDTQASGVNLPAGTMVLYSPLLTHRDPDLWPDPTAFRPDRFTAGRPAWAYIPFSAGRRTCLGTHLANYMLRVALDPLCDGHLDRLHGDPHIRSSITLRPAGPLWLWFRA